MQQARARQVIQNLVKGHNNSEEESKTNQNDDIVKIVIETFTQADQEGSLISVEKSYGHISTNAQAIHVLSGFFPNGHKPLPVETFVHNDEPTPRLLDFVHALNIVARLDQP